MTDNTPTLAGSSCQDTQKAMPEPVAQLDAGSESGNMTVAENTMVAENTPEQRPPVFIVDMDLPPRQRYKAIGIAFKAQLLHLTGIWDEIFTGFPYRGFIEFIAPFILRRVFNSEEQEEIKGLVEATGIPLFLIVAYNSFLDTFMGCTSGAVRLVKDPNGIDGLDEDRDKMVHFRTLDWGMDELRAVAIQISYHRGGKIIAQALTYAGFVGTLTGVRKDLSISLNFRPAADENTRTRTILYHKLLVILGLRRSISSQLRSFLLPEPGKEPITLTEIIKTFPSTPSSISYITLCDGDQAVLLEQDIHHANVTTSNTFLAGTNHDARMERWKASDYKAFTQKQGEETAGITVDLLEDSQHRKKCIRRLYEHATSKRRLRAGAKKHLEGGIGIKTVASWLQTWPTMNECTHFSCVMDPKEGEIVWAKNYLKPPTAGE
ncbi:hypothetical protein ABW19_dt0202229 [Dactylella cylindrospora]|nr:hypothetical protein ABW19_dt0202229 [Dactylella cylindrospora]